MNKKRRNIIIPYKSFILKDDKKIYITSIRLYKNDDLQKIEVGFYHGTNLVSKFSTAKLAVHLVSNYNDDFDAITFKQSSKKQIEVLFVDRFLSVEFYQRYLQTMYI